MNTNRFSQLSQEPIFIIGAARSGTTWVYDIFNAHPLVAGVFESWLFTPRDGVGSLFSEAHWPPNYSGLSRTLSREELIPLVRNFVENVMSFAIEDDHRFLVEKSPSHLYQMALILDIFPKARFIHVVRDGRDVAVSVLAAAQSWVPGWKTTFGRNVASSAKAWHDAVRRVRRQSETLGEEHVLEVRYEALKEHPIQTYREMFDFCSIPYQDADLETILKKTDFATNYKPGETKFRRGGRTGDWKQAFSRRDAMTFHAVAGSMLIELGYEEDGQWCRQSPRKRRGAQD